MKIIKFPFSYALMVLSIVLLALFYLKQYVLIFQHDSELLNQVKSRVDALQTMKSQFSSKHMKNFIDNMRSHISIFEMTIKQSRQTPNREVSQKLQRYEHQIKQWGEYIIQQLEIARKSINNEKNIEFNQVIISFILPSNISSLCEVLRRQKVFLNQEYGMDIQFIIQDLNKFQNSAKIQEVKDQSELLSALASYTQLEDQQLLDSSLQSLPKITLLVTEDQSQRGSNITAYSIYKYGFQIMIFLYTPKIQLIDESIQKSFKNLLEIPDFSRFKLNLEEFDFQSTKNEVQNKCYQFNKRLMKLEALAKTFKELQTCLHLFEQQGTKIPAHLLNQIKEIAYKSDISSFKYLRAIKQLVKDISQNPEYVPKSYFSFEFRVGVFSVFCVPICLTVLGYPLKNWIKIRRQKKRGEVE